MKLKSLNKIKRLAFTLSEVLITLSIIGVVAMLTLPPFIGNHQKKVYATQLRKVYNEVMASFSQVITDSNAMNLAESSFFAVTPEVFLHNYFKTIKVCSALKYKECLANSYSNIDGDNIQIDGRFLRRNSACAILADGASVCITPNVNGDNIFILIDINAKAKPNKLGRDLFNFSINYNGDLNLHQALSGSFKTKCITTTYDDQGYCIGQIINDGWQMRY